MDSGDFLRKHAETPLSGRYLAAGVPCNLLTNFEPILKAARESFFPAPDSQSLSAFHLRFCLIVGAFAARASACRIISDFSRDWKSTLSPPSMGGFQCGTSELTSGGSWLSVREARRQAA